MSKPRKIFLSHSSLDGVLATLLESEMKRELGDDFIIFRSTRADAINSGESWFKVIRQEIDESDALVVLITETAKNSAWVGFELGYFWRKENIHALHHPRVALPSPFSILQSKKLTVRDELLNFFKTLCAKLGVKYEAKADVDAIIALGNQIVIMPVEDKSLGKFVEYLENSEWQFVVSGQPAKGYGHDIWICQDMIDYEIKSEYKGVTKISLFPQRNIKAYNIGLFISDKIVFVRPFIQVGDDEYITSLPLPSQDTVQGWYWSKGSLEMKVARIISTFDGVRPKTPEDFDRELEKFANQYGIAIVD